MSGLGRLVEVSRSPTDTRTPWHTERWISPSQRPLPTKQPQKTKFHAVSGIQIPDPSSPADYALDRAAIGTVHPCDTGDVAEVEMDGAFSV